MTVHFRPGTSDERVLKEVLERRCYRRVSANFDVEAGERWLDLGANIGAFAIYCERRGATVECFEPDADCFALLERNVRSNAILHRQAVVADRNKNIVFFSSPSPTDFSRGTVCTVNKFKSVGKVPTYWAGNFVGQSYDGVKMDIEGAEGPILDNWYLPRCDKFVLEYHSSRDVSVANFVRRLTLIRKHFHWVEYPPEFDRIIAEGFTKFERWLNAPQLPKGGRFVQYPAADRVLFAWGQNES